MYTGPFLSSMLLLFLLQLVLIRVKEKSRFKDRLGMNRYEGRELEAGRHKNTLEKRRPPCALLPCEAEQGGSA